MPKNCVFAWLLPCFKGKVTGWAEGQGQGQISGVQRSKLGARLCQVQQRAITVITSRRCLSVISGCIFVRLNFRDFTVLGNSRALNFRDLWLEGFLSRFANLREN